MDQNRKETKVKMHPSSLINAVFLCLLNASFMIAGVSLNFVVVISLWRSSQLRKKLCYFMILVLSCFDLTVVVVGHPLVILSTILWSMQKFDAGFEAIWKSITVLGSFSLIALLMLNIDRFLALTFPFFHQTAVTKGKLTLFLALQIIIATTFTLLTIFYPKTNVYFPIVIIVFLL